MWRVLLDYGRRIFSLGRESERHSKAIEALAQRDDRFAAAIEKLVLQHQQMRGELVRLRDLVEHGRQTDQRDRENLLLRL